MFWYDAPGLVAAYRDHFGLLWSLSEEFGDLSSNNDEQPIQPENDNLREAYFNTANYEIGPNGLRDRLRLKAGSLTKQIVRALDEAQASVDIAQRDSYYDQSMMQLSEQRAWSKSKIYCQPR